MKSFKELKIIFMGTPEFALPVLTTLITNCNVVCVVTKTDKPKGRGNIITPSPVKQAAIDAGIDVLQPQSVRTDEFADALRKYDADLFVVVAYGKILPQDVLDIPKLGCINVHASILPKYRGSAPLWHCVINGEKEVGITTMMMDFGMDTGDILLMSKIPLTDEMTMGDVHDELSKMGGPLILETIDKLISGNLIRIKQDHTKASYAPMISRQTGSIDWSKSAWEIHNLIRGTNPFPVSYSYLNDERIKIWSSVIAESIESNEEPGTIIEVSQKGIDVVTGNGIIRILEIQGESSKKMFVRDYLNGHKITIGNKFVQRNGD